MLAIAIANYNHAAYLPEVVASCLASGNEADEVIVVDDASTDDSRAVLRALASRHSRLRVIEHEVNRGPAAAQNTAVAASQCDWIQLRAADDLCPPGSLATFRELAVRFPEAGLITGDVVYFTANPARGVRERLGRVTEPVAVEAASFLERFGGNIIHGAASFVRTSWLREAGGQDPALRWHSDWFLLLQLGLSRGFVYAPEVFGAMRLNPQSYNAAGTAVHASQTLVLTRLVEKLEADPALLERFLVCGCLDFFGDPLRRLVLAGDPPRRQRFAALLDGPIPTIAEARNATGLATVFRAFLTRHAATIQEHVQRTAIFGAGGHTRQLLAVWREFDLPTPVLILDRSAPRDGRDIDGIPVRDPRAIAAFDDPLVVLSSKSYESLFASTMETVLPRIPYLRIWGADEN